MNVRSIFRPWVVSVDGDERLADAAGLMQNEQVGSVVVMVGGQFAGILTERDLTRAIAEGTDPRDATATEYMTATPAAVHLDADLHQVASTMFEFECRHLPVLSEDDSQVIGMVSIRDLLGTAIRPGRPPRLARPPVLLRQRADGSLLIGEHTQETPATNPRLHHARALATQAARFLPVLAGVAVDRWWLAYRAPPRGVQQLAW